MKINGKQVVIKEHMTVEAMLEQEGYHLLRIAVERNGAILPKELYAVTLAGAEDVYEVVNFVGGG